MVVIQIKTSDQDSFLYETTCDTTNDALVREITQVWNMRLRLDQLVGGLREMAKYGPMKHPNKAGLDEIGENYNGEVVEKGPYYQPDPTGARTGNGPGPQLSETIERVVQDTEAALSQVNTTRKIATSLAMLQEKLDTIRGVTIMGKSTHALNPTVFFPLKYLKPPHTYSFLLNSVPHGSARVGHGAADDRRQ